MKPILLVLSLLSFHFSFGQHYLGVKVAPGIQTTTYDTGIESSSSISLRSGLHYGYRFNEEKPWGIQTGIYYNQRGYQINDITLAHGNEGIQAADYIVKQDNIGLNALFKVERNFLYVSAGPCFEYNLNQTFLIDYENESIMDKNLNIESSNLSEAFYFGYEVNLGAQFSLTEKLQFFTELSINQVFGQKSELIPGRPSYLNMNLAFGLNFHF